VRIAITNWSRRRAGGIESYLDALTCALHERGHQLAFCYEMDAPTTREQIALPEGIQAWCVADMGVNETLDALRDWQPDLIFAHRLFNTEFETGTLAIAPAVFFSHDYNGMCISGAKSFKSPQIEPCSRKFGWPCLLHYYPHRCGGLNPLTMLSDYKSQSKRQELLRRYKAVVTNSLHMQAELARHGLDSMCVYLPVTNGLPPARTQISTDARLLFLGRMDFHKGGQVFIEALREVCATLKKPVHVTFAGDGPERERWQRRAAQLQVETEHLKIEFVGWQDERKRDSLLSNCDLLVVPSLWPEPFGLVGPEAGLRGVPVAAFAVGGIREWLKDGINGYLASGDKPEASGLAGAIVNCLHDPLIYQRLKRGAVEMALRFNMENHLAALLKVFEKAVSSNP
jgi:glycosyltransferase involved in cell wall biosynthesis